MWGNIGNFSDLAKAAQELQEQAASSIKQVRQQGMNAGYSYGWSSLGGGKVDIVSVNGIVGVTHLDHLLTITLLFGTVVLRV